jgi:phosphoadenosine phosphosulfate reductase
VFRSPGSPALTFALWPFVQDVSVTTTAGAAATWTADELQQVAEQAGRELEGASAHAVLRWAHETFGDGLAIASSMGNGLLAHLAGEAAPGATVLFLDTGYHFAETIGTRDAVAATYDVNMRTVLPLLTVEQQDAEHGRELWRRDPAACCRMRKVEPLARALEGYVAWASGIRRDEAPSRADTGVVEWDAKRQMVKVNPIATWTEEEADRYIAEHAILVNPLVDDGYPSIGCAPCTQRVEPGADPRSGRWAGTNKTECGLHL